MGTPSPPDGVSSPKRIGYVDGLRAVAVLSVVIHHSTKYDLTLPLTWSRHILLEGSHGVDLFFVISGFCLSYPTLAALRAGGSASFSLSRFWAKRLVRILPPFWIALAAFALGGLAIEAAGLQTPSPAWIEPPSFAALARQFFLLDPNAAWTNGSFWSLAIEFRWYIVFPLLLALWVRSPRAFGAVALASFAAFHLTRLEVWDFATLPAFMLGIVAADIQTRSAGSWRWAVPGFAASLGAALLLEPKTLEGFYEQTQAGWQLASFFFVVAVGSMPAARRIFGAYPLAVIGLASYSIYLVHEPIIALLEYYSGLSMIAAAAVAIVIGFVFWRVFERPTVEGPIRERLVRAAGSFTARVTAWLRIDDALEMTRAGAAVTTQPPQGQHDLQTQVTAV